MLDNYYVDLHIHIGRTMYNRPVKITGSKKLTLTNILEEATDRKGLDMIGIIDAHVPAVQEELKELLNDSKACEVEGGGVLFKETTLILGSELEVYDENCKGPVHVLCYLPNLAKMQVFTKWLTERVTNVHLSSQRVYCNGRDLQKFVKDLDGLFIPAHAFTPFKSLYGKGVTKSLTEVFDPALIDGIELGLSSDSKMADQISELEQFPFLTNSDAHSLAKIAREYQVVQMESCCFNELYLALKNEKGRKISANYGLNPKLGKYHASFCDDCLKQTNSLNMCEHCQSKKVTKGVSLRLAELADRSTDSPQRQPYIYQVPLEYIPKLGPKTYEALLDYFGTEMNVLHKATQAQLEKVVTKSIAAIICNMREGKVSIQTGGGGKYGKIAP